MCNLVFPAQVCPNLWVWLRASGVGVKVASLPHYPRLRKATLNTWGRSTATIHTSVTESLWTGAYQTTGPASEYKIRWALNFIFNSSSQEFGKKGIPHAPFSPHSYYYQMRYLWTFWLQLTVHIFIFSFFRNNVSGTGIMHRQHCELLSLELLSFKRVV